MKKIAILKELFDDVFEAGDYVRRMGQYTGNNVFEPEGYSNVQGYVEEYKLGAKGTLFYVKWEFDKEALKENGGKPLYDERARVLLDGVDAKIV